MKQTTSSTIKPVSTLALQKLILPAQLAKAVQVTAKHAMLSNALLVIRIIFYITNNAWPPVLQKPMKRAQLVLVLDYN